MERKWTDRQFHVQDNADVSHKYLKIYCNTNQLSVLEFCVPYPKPHGARRASTHYNLHFDLKIRDNVCAIRLILCASVACI